MTHDPDWSKDVDGTPMFRGVRSTGTRVLSREKVGGMQIVTAALTWPDEETPKAIMEKMAKPMGRVLATVWKDLVDRKR